LLQSSPMNPSQFHLIRTNRGVYTDLRRIYVDTNGSLAFTVVAEELIDNRRIGLTAEDSTVFNYKHILSEEHMTLEVANSRALELYDTSIAEGFVDVPDKE
jgi:hypothetical protein